jgi:two-component system sensor histidine kinase MprB
MGLGGRLAVAFAVLVALTALVVGVLGLASTRRQVTEEIDDFLRTRSAEITSGERPKPRGRSEDRQRATELDIASAVEADADVQVIDERGAVVSTTGVDLPVDEEDLEIADKRMPDRLRTVNVDGIETRMITSHLDGGGAVQVARPLDEANTLLGELQTRLLIIAVGMALLAAMLGWLLARRTTSPLRRLTATVDRVAETRDFSVAVDIDQPDEVGRLARGFDRLLNALELSRQQQTRLVEDAAHELKTPLTSIKANVDFLAIADTADAETRREALDGVRDELSELSHVIDEIIDLAKDQQRSPSFERLDLGSVVENACAQFRQRSSRLLDVTTSSSDVVGDADALRRAILNLLSNADKYSPADAKILVGSDAGIVTVDDAGPGIPEDDRELVFERFYRSPTARSASGSGLGLAIVRSIVEAHDGTVAIGESPMGGAQFFVRLPTLDDGKYQR